jgi:phospholipase C
MIVISPWSKGGWVSSEVFDHTSLIRFIERRFAGTFPSIVETNITPWRRAVVGDLSGAFDFAAPSDGPVALPSTARYVPPDAVRHPDYTPALPAEGALPVQEPGVRPARAVPYELHADAVIDPTAGTLSIEFLNRGRAAAVFQVRSSDPTAGPWTYTVDAGASVSDSWMYTTDYELSVYGPNGFFRSWKFGNAADSPDLNVHPAYHPRSERVSLSLHNRGSTPMTVAIWDAYAAATVERNLRAGECATETYALSDSFGWYDLTITRAGFEQRVAGHLESGQDSMTDPALG